MSLIRLGEPSGGMSARLDRIAATWAEAGFQVEAYDDIDRLIWEKFLCNCAYSAPCTVFRCTVGELLADPELAAISEGCVREVAALAAAKGVQLSFGDPVAYARAFGQNIQDARPSMLLDHMAERRSEIGAINGAAAVLGSELSISVPYNQTLSAVVRMRERLFP